ncbi:hypothetical protein [Micropruina sp.]|uniref:hypothetical protein n=1 Tax=Micropruina sp. TaxID=2737536 RepID=UPI0039E4EE0B
MKPLAITVASAALVALAGCSSPAATPVPSVSAAPAGTDSPAPTAKPQPLNLTGKCKQTNSNTEDAWQAITIKAHTIEIHWVSDGGDTKSVYWVGTFTAPQTTEDTYAWTSKRDRKKTDNALLASTSKTKAFSYAGGVLGYEVSLMGTTTTVKAERI